MAFQQMYRVSCAWQGWPGAPGVSQMYLTGAIPTQATIDAIRAFFNGLITILPAGLTVQVPSSGDSMNATDGKIVDSWSVGNAPAVVTGSGAGVYAGNAGAVIHWLSGDVINGRRLRGRTFIVPIVGNGYDASGSLSNGTIGVLQTAAAAYVNANQASASVWSRPFTHPTDPTKNREGTARAITGFRVPDLAVTLRSRRV